MSRFSFGLSTLALAACTQAPGDSQDEAKYPTLHPGEFNMIVAVDDSANILDDSEIGDFFSKVDYALFVRTGVHMGVLKILHLSDGQNLEEELADYPEVVLEANGVVLIDKSEFSRKTGGGNFVLSPSFQLGIDGYCNTFQPMTVGNENLLGMHLDWHHRYAACGYDQLGDDTHLIQAVSSNGECRGVDGVPCVMKNGYSMCSTMVDDYHSEEIDRYSVGVVVHEIMHFFGEKADPYQNHYGTPNCDIRAVETRDFECDAEHESICYFQICPFTYENFAESMNNCR